MGWRSPCRRDFGAVGSRRVAGRGFGFGFGVEIGFGRRGLKGWSGCFGCVLDSRGFGMGPGLDSLDIGWRWSWGWSSPGTRCGCWMPWSLWVLPG